MENKKVKIAIVYDFDGTLTPKNMQEYSFIPSLNMNNKKFWKYVKNIAKEKNADEILSYMYVMLKKASEKNVKIDKKSIQEQGGNIKFFEGVEKWFNRIKTYGKSKNIEIQHFIISSGLKEIIEGTSIAKNFKKIYASKFMYDQHEVAIAPAVAINFTTKTQYLFRINKGCFE